jgi:hypothetical protein
MPTQQASNPLHPVALSTAIEFAAAVADAPRQFSGVAYGGGIITDHPMFSRVAFDLATTKVVTPTPAFLEHKHDKRAGVIKSAEIGRDIRISGHMLNTDAAAEVVRDAGDGMPWQMSVGIWPGKVDKVAEGKSIELNGQTMAGPLVVFRNNRVRETSFCALGADDSTSAQFFSIGRNDAPLTQPNEVPEMDKAEHDAIVADLNTKLTAATEGLTAANAKVAELEGKFSAQARAARLASVKALFTAIGREFKSDTDATVLPYLEMSDAAFAVLDADLRANKPQLDPSLTREHANSNTAGTADAGNVDDIETKARQYVAEQAKLGLTVRVSDAVHFVTRKAA